MQNAIKNLWLPLCLFMSGTSVRADIPTDKRLTVQQLRNRFSLRSDVFVVDADGTRLLAKGGQSKTWLNGKGESKLKIRSGNSSSLYQPIELKMDWDIRDDGTIQVQIEQYAKADISTAGDIKYVGLLARKDYVIKDFSAIEWVSAAEKNSRVIVRLLPELQDDESPTDLAGLPMAVTDLIAYDSRGIVWSHHVNASGKHIAIGTHEGTLALSYFPFKGAVVVGKAKGHKIQLDQLAGFDGSVTLVSESSILPDGVIAKVYGVYLPKLRTASRTSTFVSAIDNTDDFVAEVKRRHP